MSLTPASPRLRYRPVDEAAADDLHRVLLDPHVYRYLCDGAALERDAVAGLARDSEGSFARLGLGLWLLSEGTGEDVGFVGFVEQPEGPPMLLYALLPGATGRGLAREAARAAIRYAREVAGLGEIRADVDAVNERSVVILEELGFVRSGQREGAFGGLYDYLLPADEG